MIGFAQLIADNGWFWTTILGLSVGVIVFVCALRRSDLAPLAVMASVPIQRELLIGQVTHHITYTQICLAGFFAGALILFVGGRLRVRLDPLSLLSIAVGCLDGLSILAGGEQGNWAGENYRWWVSIGFFIVGRSYFDQRSIIRLKRFIIVMVGVGATWALIQIGSDAGPANFSRNGLTRAFGGFGEPNPFAAFMVAITLMVIPVAYSQWATPDGHRQALAACAVAVAILSVFATQSRGGLLGLATGVVVLGLSAGLSSGERSKRVTIITLAIGMSVLIPATVVLAPWTEFAREVTVANWAEQERAAHWVPPSQ